MRRRRKFWVSLAVIAIVLGVGFWWRFLRETRPTYTDPLERFKHGTIGVETAAGIPLDIWLALPDVFPDFLPSGDATHGYSDFGFLMEGGHELPIGFSRTHKGFDRVGVNCAACHIGSYRTSFDSETIIVVGAPATRVDPQAYLRFLFRCARDPRFKTDTVLAAIRQRRSLRLDEATLLRVLIPFTRRAINDLDETYAWADANPRWGPGRIDPFNPAKYGMLRRPIDGSIGNSDMMSLWGIDVNHGERMHWDGLNGSLREVILSSALGDGASPRTLDLDRMEQLENWLVEQRPPSFPGRIDRALTDHGAALFDAHCARCHAHDGAKMRTVIPLLLDPSAEDDSHIATDPERASMWNTASAEAYNRYGAGYAWDFEDFQNLEGYLPLPLDGVWLRGPYLHNGSVPTLWHLLNPDERPVTFYRGCDVIEARDVGFVWNVPDEGGRPFFRFNTRLRGNSNRGHIYGHNLQDDEKRALIEYLKTL